MTTKVSCKSVQWWQSEILLKQSINTNNHRKHQKLWQDRLWELWLKYFSLFLTLFILSVTTRQHLTLLCYLSAHNTTLPVPVHNTTHVGEGVLESVTKYLEYTHEGSRILREKRHCIINVTLIKISHIIITLFRTSGCGMFYHIFAWFYFIFACFNSIFAWLNFIFLYRLFVFIGLYFHGNF